MVWTSSNGPPGCGTHGTWSEDTTKNSTAQGIRSGLEGKDIPLTARIFTVADVFDALTSRRPYKAPLGCAEALEILQCGRGTHFDPEVVSLFADMAEGLHERYSYKTGSDLKAELIDMSWRYFQTDAEKLV